MNSDLQVALVVAGSTVTTTVSALVLIWRLVMKYQLGIIDHLTRELRETKSSLIKTNRRFDRLIMWLRGQDIKLPLDIIYEEEVEKVIISET